jgi:1-acyl-sn-glycerol-3-phosphate acyltransferase
VVATRSTLARVVKAAEFGAVAPRPSPLYRTIAGLSRPVTNLLLRPKTTGIENVPREGGFVMAANHLSNFDPWAVGLPIFPWRFLRFMGKSELFWWPLGPIISAGGAFKVRRGQADIGAIETAVELAREGHAVMMFPEGTRRKKGMVKKYQPRAHTGAARIALSAGVPLIPAAIKGTDNLLRLGPLRVAYGEPVQLDDLRAQDPREASQEATDRLMAEIERLEATLE